MKLLIKLVAVVGMMAFISGCTTSTPKFQGLDVNGNCPNPKCQCAKPCKCKPVCMCGQDENLTRDKK